MSTVNEDIEDLVGGGAGSATPRADARREREKANAGFGAFKAHKANSHRNGAADEAVDLNIDGVQQGVTVSWLAAVFSLTSGSVRIKLANCPFIEHPTYGRVYALKAAAPFLCKPVVDMESFIRNVRIEDLPTKVQESYWRALKLRHEWEARSGLLWETEDVLEVFGETFQAIKFAIQLWVDDMEREVAITPEQRKILQAKCDGLQQQIFNKLMEVPKKRKTKNVRQKFEEAEQKAETEAAIGNLV